MTARAQGTYRPGVEDEAAVQVGVANPAEFDHGDLDVTELAHRAGLTVRTVRAYQTAGLIPPPARRGRVAYYGPRHLTLLSVISRLRGQGLGLRAIRTALEERAGGAGPDIAAYGRRLAESMGEPAPVLLTHEDLRELWGQQLTEERIERLVSTAFLQPVDQTRFVSPSRAVMQAGRELALLGVSLDGAIELTEALSAHTQLLAERYVDVLLRQVASSAAALATDPERCAEVRAALGRLGPLTASAVQAALPLAVREQFERALAAPEA
jgi:DNA-binding transcriptional MerR regulator